MILHDATLGTIAHGVFFVPPDVPRDNPDETVKALVYCLVLGIFLAVTTTTVTVIPVYLQVYEGTVVTSSQLFLFFTAPVLAARRPCA